jgi:hypothetical protein
VSSDRTRISREEIGILMSYATRPDRMTKEVIQKLVDGVTGPELIEIAAWVGLPESTAVRLVDANRPSERRSAGSRGLLETRFRRTLVGILVFMVVLNIALSVGSNVEGPGLVVLVGASVGAAYLVYRVILAIAPS